MVLLPLPAADLRIGNVGLDTPQHVYFSTILNDPAHAEHVPGAKIVAGYKGGSADLENIMAKADACARELVPLTVKIHGTVEEVAKAAADKSKRRGGARIGIAEVMRANGG